MAILPPPEDGGCYLVVESTFKHKTGQPHPLAKKGRLNEDSPYSFGLHIVLVMRQWGNYRLPVDFEVVRRKDDLRYRSENRLFRWRLVRCRRPPWAEMVVVVAAAAFASAANINLIQQRGDGLVMAMARTWRFDKGQAVKELVPICRKGPTDAAGYPWRSRVGVGPIGPTRNGLVCDISETSLWC